MAELPVQAGAPKRGRSRAAVAAAAALFPLLVSAGIFAPGLVQLALQAGGALAGDAPSGPPPSAFEHRPLPAPRDPVVVFTPVALELDRLFFESLFRGADTAADGGLGVKSAPGEGSEPLAFPRHDAEAIVLDQLGAPETAVVFKDALIPDEPPEVAALDLGSLFLPLCPTLPAQDCMRFDDFTRVVPGAQVPEPASAVLLGFGLVLIGVRRRRS